MKNTIAILSLSLIFSLSASEQTSVQASSSSTSLLGKFLKKNNPKPKKKNLQEALLKAIQTDDASQVDSLIKQGANVMEEIGGTTPIAMFALNNPEIYNLLVKKNSKVEQQVDMRGVSMKALYKKKQAMLEKKTQ